MHLLSGAPLRPRALDVVVLEPLLLVELLEAPLPDRPSVATVAARKGGDAVHVYRRDGADALLAWLLKHGPPLAFWTHERAGLARAAMRRAFPAAWRARRFFLARASCVVHDGTYVKDVRRLRSPRSLLVDFVPAQVPFHVEHAIRPPLLLAADADLARVLAWFRRRWGTHGAVHV